MASDDCTPYQIYGVCERVHVQSHAIHVKAWCGGGLSNLIGLVLNLNLTAKFKIQTVFRLYLALFPFQFSSCIFRVKGKVETGFPGYTVKDFFA